MKQGKTIQLAFHAMNLNRLRTFLMMLGIVIGITTLTVIVSMGKGASAKVLKSIQAFGTNGVMVFAGGGKFLGPPDEKTNTLTLDDADAISHEIRGIKSMDKAIVRVGRTVKYENKNTNCVIYGGTTNFSSAWEWGLESGDFFTDEDLTGMARVAVLGKTVVKELYGKTDPIGTSVNIENITFKVIGVLASRGISPAALDLDNRIIIPYTTAARRVFNTPYIGAIRMAVADPVQSEKIEESIIALLRERHHVQPGFPEDFRVRGPSSISRILAKSMSGTLDLFLALVSLISLIVGGIVVMNIMLISVSERTAEIGLRRAVGAKKMDIRNQFLVESLLTTVLGGVLGASVGVAVAMLLPVLSKGKLQALPSWEPFALGFVFSALVGVVAGIHPAKKAAAMDPINALKG